MRNDWMISIFQCKCVYIFYCYLFFNNFEREIFAPRFFWGVDVFACCILQKFWGYMYAKRAPVDIDISLNIHGRSVDMGMDMNGKFYIHGNPPIVRLNNVINFFDVERWTDTRWPVRWVCQDTAQCAAALPPGMDTLWQALVCVKQRPNWFDGTRNC